MQTTTDRVQVAVGSTGLAHREVAEQTGLSPSKLSKSLHGQRRFSAEELVGIAELSGTRVDWLLTGRGIGPLEPAHVG